MNPSTPLGRGQWRDALPGLPFLVVVVAFVYAAFFAFAQTDDFCTFGRLIWTRAANPFAETWFLYLNWTGRYSSTFLVTLCGWLIGILPVADHWVYSAYVAMVLLVFGFGLYLAQRLIGDGGRGRWLSGLVLFAFVLVLTPSKLEGLLWMTGAVVYTLGITAILWQALAVQRDLHSPMRGWGVSWWSLAAIAFATGFNELLALSVGGMILLTAVAYRERKYWPQHFCYMAVFGIAFLLTTLAPGNFARDSLSAAVRHDLAIAVSLGWQSLDLFWTTRFTPDALMVGCLAMASIAAGIWAGRVKGVAAAPARRLWPLGVALISALPLHSLVYSFLTGEAMPGRIVNQAYLMGLVGVGLVATWVGLRAATGWGKRVPAGMAVVALGLVLLTSVQFRSFSSVIKEDAPGWRAENVARLNLLRTARQAGLTRAELPAFSNRPKLVSVLQGGDISDDSTYWVNTCLAGYSQLAEVLLVPAVPATSDSEPVRDAVAETPPEPAPAQ